MIDLEKLKALRPFLYHLTAASNIARIRQSRHLVCAASLLEEAGQAEQARRRRARHLAISVGGDPVLLRDQAPLHAGNIEFEDGWDLPRLVELLNGRVFFWPGSASGPILSGQRHFERYASAGEDIAILRVPTASLLSANPDAEPELCRFNSGAPGSRGGPKSPRGGATFQRASGCAFSAGEVKEVTFVGGVVLPGDTQMSVGPGWSTL